MLSDAETTPPEEPIRTVEPVAVRDERVDDENPR
jgi:hypothetical protein